MDRTNIIDADEVARAMAAASQGKGKGKGRKKTTEAPASSPSKPKKTAAAPATRVRSKTPASPTSPTAATSSAPRFYEANGLKIPLYNQNGQGNKKRPTARLSKTLLKYNTDDLLDIVGQYASADKRQELKTKGLSKIRLANWIEEKETLALGRNPRSDLSFPEDSEDAEPSDDITSFLAPTMATPSGPKTKKHTATAPASNNQEDYMPTAAKGKGPSHYIGGRKRSAPDVSSKLQPPAKLRKRDDPANSAAIPAEHSAKEPSTDNSVDDVIPTPSQTDAQTAVYNDTDCNEHGQNAFFRRTGMDPNDPDRSSMIVKGDGEDRVLTATSHETFRGPVTWLYETTVPHNTTKSPPQRPPPIPYLKPGVHGRNGDFQSDDDRRTGVGHQIEPSDQLKWDEYSNFHAMLYQQFPHYPTPTNGLAADKETKGAWDQWQRWYGDFTEKYPGYAVFHLWPCGCEVISEGDDSEESEEE